jgi:hypothetical protein
MPKSLATIAALFLLMGCRFDEVKEYAACRKANPIDEHAADKCLENVALKWEKEYAWQPRVRNKRETMP